MTILELAERDLRKAEINLDNGAKRPNITIAELTRLQELCFLREAILEIVRRADNEQREAD